MMQKSNLKPFDFWRQNQQLTLHEILWRQNSNPKHLNFGAKILERLAGKGAAFEILMVQFLCASMSFFGGALGIETEKIYQAYQIYAQLFPQ